MKNLNYGLIGNCRSAALVAEDGCIAWCCLPAFDASSVFAKLLDGKRGGEFGIRVPTDYKTKQRYIPKTNVLETTFSQGENTFKLIDFMPRYKTDTGEYHCPPDIIRYIQHVSGRPKIRIIYDPRPAYGQYEVKTEVRAEYIKTGTVRGSYESIYLYSDLDLGAVAEGKPIPIERDGYLVLSYNQKIGHVHIDRIILEYEMTRVYWLHWAAKTRRFLRYNDEILRSALVLKLLDYQKTGAILAAVTTSLPEELGSTRNWDYRYCWLRDASMAIAAMAKLGHYRSAKRFVDFMLDIIPFKDEKIQIVYGINGQKKLHEKTLDWLSGYENSSPVRIGNAAYKQKQNDIFGVMLDVIYQYLMIFKREAVQYREDVWTVVRTLGRHIERNWAKKDRGIWEFRGWRKHYTFSKALCWVGMDRAERIARLFGMPGYIRVWSEMKEKIRKDILQKAWDPEIQAFTQAYGEPHLDAACLLLEHYGFIAADDPKYVSTVKRIREQLETQGLMYRYRNPDDFGVPRSSFTACSFWLIKSLYRIGEKKQAEALFEKILSYRNHVGLLSEDIDVTTKRLLGNFPQGYSHLALIDAAVCLAGEDVTDAVRSPSPGVAQDEDRPPFSGSS